LCLSPSHLNPNADLFGNIKIEEGEEREDWKGANSKCKKKENSKQFSNIHLDTALVKETIGHWEIINLFKFPKCPFPLWHPSLTYSPSKI
jgi:hypothetical protein